LEREIGIEPTTFSLGNPSEALAAECTETQVVPFPLESHSAGLHSVDSDAPFCSPFAAPVLQGFLTVRGVAALLGVSTATIYKLCWAGELPYFRVLDTMRIAGAAVAAFLERQERTGPQPA
jgi:excisionase family DNA binding protein